jgi:aspartate/tyrosine/aromatic aminotransferase
MNGATVYISDPTWRKPREYYLIFLANHKNIFNAAGVPWKTYRYYNPSNVSLNFEGMCEDLKVNSQN